MQIKAGTLARTSVLAVAAAVGAPALASGQYVEVPRAPAYALRGVTVVQPDGRRTENVTVVVRGEFIAAMGRDVAVPSDAELLEGDSLVVYPGLVDGDGKADFEFPRTEVDRDEVEIWNASRELRGFMPARRVVSFLTADGEKVASQRKAGIVAAAVHPDGAMMPGQSTLVLYRKDADLREELVIRPVLGPKFELRGGQGVYPATLFGVMATFRQSFLDARHREATAAAQQESPLGLTAPAYDPDYGVLQDVLSGAVPVYFEANDAADILRVLGLADEFGFKPVLLGGAEAWKVADELKRRDIPVFVDVDFSEPRQWKPEDETAEGEEEPPTPLDAAAEREKLEFEGRYANAGRLVEAGLTVVLTSGGSGKLLEGARKAVEYGLPETAALAAVTRTPAQLLGIPSVARVEAGLPATFIVTNGPLFAEDTRIAYTFVEGAKEEGATSRPAPAAGDSANAVVFGGKWDMTIDAQGQVIRGTMTIVQEGATFTGTLDLEGQEARLRDGVINGNAIEVTAVMEQGGQSLEIEIKGTVEGDSASGDADAGPMGVATWTARRTGPGGGR